MSCEVYTNGSAPTVQHTMGTLPANFCPQDLQSLFNQIAISLISQLPANFATFVIGSDTPSANDQDKLWFRLDASNFCQPMGFFIYWQGEWVRATPHPIHPGIIVPVYDANWATYTLALYGTQAAIDAKVASEIELYDMIPSTGDGGLPFWRLCDGTNGTPDLRSRFVRGAGAGASSASQPSSGGHIPDILHGSVGGEESHILRKEEIPLTNLDGATTDPNKARGGAYEMVGTANSAHNNVPPYLGLYYMMRTTRIV